MLEIEGEQWKRKMLTIGCDEALSLFHIFSIGFEKEDHFEIYVVQGMSVPKRQL